MAITEMLCWWYTAGWGVFCRKIKNFFLGVFDYFSMSSLVRTLFKPFRQISAGTARAESSLDLKFHMFIDRLVSRVVGFCSRLALLIAGTFIIIVVGIISGVMIILWPIIPLAPVAGAILMAVGVTL